jgi:hypothetical protein
MQGISYIKFSPSTPRIRNKYLRDFPHPLLAIYFTYNRQYINYVDDRTYWGKLGMNKKFFIALFFRCELEIVLRSRTICERRLQISFILTHSSLSSIELIFHLYTYTETFKNNNSFSKVTKQRVNLYSYSILHLCLAVLAKCYFPDKLYGFSSTSLQGYF